jgi:hypothetical protein
MVGPMAARRTGDHDRSGAVAEDEGGGAVEQSVKSDSFSQPITSTYSALPPRTMSLASETP